MSLHVDLPREGHFNAAVHVMAHVHQRYNSRLVYNPLYPEIDHSAFKKYNCSESYQCAKEAIPMNTAEHQGKEIDIHMFVDRDYAVDAISHRLRSGFLIYVNTPLVQWSTKK